MDFMEDHTDSKVFNNSLRIVCDLSGRFLAFTTRVRLFDVHMSTNHLIHIGHLDIHRYSLPQFHQATYRERTCSSTDHEVQHWHLLIVRGSWVCRRRRHRIFFNE